MRKSVIATLLLAACSLLAAQQVMNNDSVVKLVKAGLSDDLIVATINGSPGTYDTSTDGIIALKTAGASDKVIAAIIARAAAPATPPPAPPVAAPAAPASKIPDGVDDIGIYYQAKDGSWQEIITETVTKKTGGVLKSIASDGIVKGDVNGNLKGPTSRLHLTLPENFIIYTPEGRSPGEYLLVRFRVHEKDREFRSETGGVFHQSTGAARDSVDFQVKKIAPRVYQVALGQDLGKGEYGFLAPNDEGNLGSVAGSGKMYTFSIIE
jgi:hypothetical protein